MLRVSRALASNDKSNLFHIKIGSLDVSEALFDEFMTEGIQYAIALRFLYIETKNANRKVISDINKSSSYVSIVASHTLLGSMQNTNILEHLSRKAEMETADQFDRIKYGETVFKHILKLFKNQNEKHSFEERLELLIYMF